MDLFGTPPIPGLGYQDGFVTPDEEQALIDHIGETNLAPFLFQQWTGKRFTQSYGWTYDFQTGVFAPAQPIPDWLLPFKERAALSVGLKSGDLEQALLIRYDPGAGIGWHRDRPVFEHVIGISLGHAATLRFRRRTGAKFVRASQQVLPRSLYHLSGEARHDWDHSIAQMNVTRWSITFRSLARR
ncbi:alpha-ketoglutarate-dependent dioxygenase AlkB [Croceibacterium sp. LX-88]|uniref:Alpha-ketoglutarate-dependent dioxygenase AlkB n=1 Tax=Croceibacterium selenioxidans TaxID=2838833 RepID=A0ABS5W3L3_9SPHN|nr:alpha-ketoglutarate-dependent dioxygenase AlkB [Croceibacterium selenioxidans]MBT2134345.1 alpha-ketoglutarate-dependent dioxygenase AlkB [Croceibacterium selenioxidans]